jgi:hypothetical protein
LILSDCSNGEKIKTARAEEETVVEIPEGFGPIDIRSPEFFWLLQPWKEGKLATLDGWGRFAEISFVGTNKLQIRPFSDFPRTQMDRSLLTWPEAGLIASMTGKMHHLAAVDDNKTKSHVPLLSWVYDEENPVLLDPREGLVSYTYALDWDDTSIETSLFVYNYKEDRMVYENRENDFTIIMLIAMDSDHALSWQRLLNNDTVGYKVVFYNWRTNGVVENGLTKELNKHRMPFMFGPLRNIHPEGRYLFGSSRAIDQDVMVTWDEGYSGVKVTPLDYLLPAPNMTFKDFILSADGMWASTFVTGYKGLFDERLSKRAFFHLDGRYPNGISMPIITDDYEVRQREYSAFVEHPVHGLCFAQEWHKNDQLYLRLYRMDEVLEEINKRLTDKVKD